jgi:uncharacterized Zn finger protein (UPF0148 family)
MFAYECPSCRAPAYSAANPETVGTCPVCGAPLSSSAQETEMQSVAESRRDGATMSAVDAGRGAAA